MPLRQPPLPRSEKHDVEQIRRAVQGQGRGIPQHLDSDGVRIDYSIAATSTQKKRHGLGRKLRGWYLVDGPKSVSAALNGAIDETNRDNNTLTLRNGATQAVTFSVWVY